jgi:hypothetical protein
MKNTQSRILVTVVGLSVLLLGLSYGRAASSDAGATKAGAPGASAPTFTLCKGTYALCTTAKCTAIPAGVAGAAGFLSCPCSVQQGDSVGQELCAAVPNAAPYAGQSIPSRYFPPKSMAVCKNQDNHPWAACLDMPCVVDANTAKATCVCVSSAALGSAGKGDYVATTDRYTDLTCPTGPNSTNGFLSSATFSGASAMTCFLQGKYRAPDLLNGGKWPSCQRP